MRLCQSVETLITADCTAHLIRTDLLNAAKEKELKAAEKRISELFKVQKVMERPGHRNRCPGRFV